MPQGLQFHEGSPVRVHRRGQRGAARGLESGQVQEPLLDYVALPVSLGHLLRELEDLQVERGDEEVGALGLQAR